MDKRDQMELWIHIRQPYLIYGRRPPIDEALISAPDETRAEVKRLYAQADSGYCPESCWLKRVDATLAEVIQVVMTSQNAEGMASIIEVLRLTDGR